MQDDESAVSHTRLSYLPALDGVRAAAVLAVMMFHGGIPFMDGGFMGVDAFFVLSGVLITSLLIGEWRQSLTIKLGAFWARRARRLLPALLLMLIFVAFFSAVIVPKGTYPGLRLDALATLLYVSNWHFILSNSSYFNEAAASSPLLHTWSLAVEEQFYVVWPLVVLGVLRFWRSLRGLFVLC
ncbi:MAG TPA: acyltransferase, partial [Acidimicrobiales bacterium]|nr:acyltransferase [Acidimicrobiales bacterium]